jgi:hypothetical protein
LRGYCLTNREKKYPGCQYWLSHFLISMAATPGTVVQETTIFFCDRHPYTLMSPVPQPEPTRRPAQLLSTYKPRYMELSAIGGSHFFFHYLTAVNVTIAVLNHHIASVQT